MTASETKNNPLPLAYRVIIRLIESEATVLDLGCGNGELLVQLIKRKNVRAQGIEIDDQLIFDCVARGLSVFHSDIDSGLADYPKDSFDYVILLNSIQELMKPNQAVLDALRVGRKVIVGFPNFAFWKSRLQQLFTGRTPVTPSLPYKWYETPNLHFLSILDFLEYCTLKGINVERGLYIRNDKLVRFRPNLMAQQAIFLLSMDW
jgi:methionine biosynthesis protein MetW